MADPDVTAQNTPAPPVAGPGGATPPSQASAAAAAAPDSTLESDHATCPVPALIEVVTRAGTIPVRNVALYDGTRFVGLSGTDGTLLVQLSACNGAASLKAVYQNDNSRVKREEFRIEISGINIAAGQATGGRARNFISKVQDVFGSGEGGFPGDKDFDDSYAGADLVSVGPPEGGGANLLKIRVPLATLSLIVPYRNQNDGPEVIQGVSRSGSVLCMPTSAEMQASYWGIQGVETAADGTETRSALTRLNIMNASYNRNPKGFSVSSFPSHWQDWTNMRGTMQSLADSSAANTFTLSNGPASAASTETIPSAYADALTALAAQGVPAVTSTYATDGHIMIVIGAVVKHDDEAEWLIFNDPNGTLASADSIYGELALAGPVGLRGTRTGAMNAEADVRAVQELLTRTGHYTGAPGAAVDDTNRDDPTIAAIRAFQGAGADGVVSPGGATQRRMNTRIKQGSKPTYTSVENERNGSTDDRGRHVYYNGGTQGASSGNFRLKGQAWTSVVERNTALTKPEIAERLTPGAER